MTGFHAVLVPVGRLDREEIEAAGIRAARAVKQPIEIRDSLAVPRGSEDSERGQHRAATMLGQLRSEVVKLSQGRLLGADDPKARPPFDADAFVFVTDVDLFTARTEGVLAAIVGSKHCAVVSVRRLREAFYRRRADPARQRSRLVKELMRMWGRLRGLSECADPQCVLAPSRGVPDIDAKDERFCRVCEQRLFEGKLHL